MDFINELLNSGWVQTIMASISGIGMTGVLYLVIRMLGIYSNSTKNANAAILAAQAAQKLLEAKQLEAEDLAKRFEDMESTAKKQNEMLQLLLLNAKNPTVRARAIAMIQPATDDENKAKTEDLERELNEMREMAKLSEDQTEAKIDEVSKLIDSLNVKDTKESK